MTIPAAPLAEAATDLAAAKPPRIARLLTFLLPATTLRQFLEADAQLDALVRDILVPSA